MAAFALAPTPTSTSPPLSFPKINLQTPPSSISISSLFTTTTTKPKDKNSRHFLSPSSSKPSWRSQSRDPSSLSSTPTKLAAASSSCSTGTGAAEEEEELILPTFEVEKPPLKFLLWVAIWASVSLAWFAASGNAEAAVDSIKASGFGLKIAAALRSSGFPDEAVVFALATLPVIELRGAIPVGYWMQLDPVLLTLLSVLGNIVPVPFIILYLKRFSSFLARSSHSASWFLDMVYGNAKEKAGPVKEFKWLGLMLFVAVPFPGTGAWTGAIIASILDMQFWPAVTANFCGVVLAGLLVNMLVNVGLRYAIAAGIALFIISMIMWNVLRNIRKCLSA